MLIFIIKSDFSNSKKGFTVLFNKFEFVSAFVQNKEGYIHGFTENYVKVKTPWNPELVNTLHEITLTKIDEDGSVRMEFLRVEV